MGGQNTLRTLRAQAPWSHYVPSVLLPSGALLLEYPKTVLHDLRC